MFMLARVSILRPAMDPIIHSRRRRKLNGQAKMLSKLATRFSGIGRRGRANRRGIQGATTREIVRRAEVHEVTLFRHFKSKEQLLCGILKRGLAGKATIKDENSSRKENLRESMEKYGRHYYSHFEKNKGFAGALLPGPNSMQAAIADVICPARERLVS
jgi:AcrR family transcriptional regulator